MPCDLQDIHCIPEDHVWADEFDGKWSGIFLVQYRIAREVASELKTVLSPEVIGRIDTQSTLNMETGNLDLLGKHERTKRTEEAQWSS